MEQIHYRQTAIPQFALPVDVSHFTVDDYSLQLMQTYSGDQSLIPISVSANGNCFFNALSVALFGTEEYSAALRVRALHLKELYEDNLAKAYAPELAEDLQAVVTWWLDVKSGF